MTGCGLDSNFGDLGEKLLDPDVQGLEVPGQRLVSGPHTDLSVRQDLSGDPHALAINADAELVVIDFANETHCRTPNVDVYGASIEGPTETLIPTLHREADAAWLSFSTFDCVRSGFEVAVDGLPVSRLTGSLQGSVLVYAPERSRLLLVDAWEGTVREVAEGASSLDVDRRTGLYTWFEQGTLVISSPELEELARIGTNVRFWGYSPTGEIAYLDGSTLYTARATSFDADATDLESAEVVATDACTPRFSNIAGRASLLFRSPCAEGSVRVLDLQTRTETSLADGVIGGPVVRTLGGQPFVTYLTESPDAPSGGTLWLWQGESAVRIADNAQVAPSALTPEGALLVVADVDEGGGRLLQWQDGQSTQLTDEFFDFGATRMENDDFTVYLGVEGDLGRLARLRDDGSFETLSDSVLIGSLNGRAFVTDFDGHVGDLNVLDLETGDARRIAPGVLPGSYAFTQQFEGLFALADRDLESSTSTLRLEVLQSGQHFVVQPGVTEAREVSFPSAGLLYNVVVGDRTGIWFAKTL